MRGCGACIISTMSPTQSSPPCRTWRIRSRVRSENARNIKSTSPSTSVCAVLAISESGERVLAYHTRATPLNAIAWYHLLAGGVKCLTPHNRQLLSQLSYQISSPLGAAVSTGQQPDCADLSKMNRCLLALATQNSFPSNSHTIRNRVRSENARNIKSTSAAWLVC